jgi:tRNA-specific 2-thiouridylase
MKPESYEICFVADNDYGRFLRDYIPGLGERIDGGRIELHGETIGSHRGYAFYTVGQRKGLGVSNEKPLYVKRIDAAHNVAEVDTDERLYSKALTAEHANFVKYAAIPQSKKLKAKIRYKDAGADCVVKQFTDGRIQVEFDSPRRAITPGQSVVIYENDDVVAGGIISNIME